jgi:peroxiredoxin
MKLNQVVSTAFLTALTGTSLFAQTPAPLREGVWRGVFQAGQETVPFNFEVKAGNSVATTKLYLLNAREREELTDLTQQGDSVFVPIPLYDATLRFKREGADKLTGVYRSNSSGRDLPLTAEYGKTYRFEPGVAPTVNLSGKWDVNIERGPGDVNKTVGVFEQTGSRVTGTILTVTGDYRYLDGQVSGNEFVLSSFSGSSPSVFRGKFTEDGKFTGEFRYVRGGFAATGVKNEKAALPDLYSLTNLKTGYSKLDFTFPDLNGKSVSLNDPKYKNKVVIVTILGSWCPNCIDETAFLAPWYKANRKRGVEIIGLAFERKNDLTFAKTALTRLLKRYDVQYDILFAGIADKKVASEALPALNKVLAFPTTIIIDKKGNVSQIHTGYTGPATGAYYDEYVQEFNSHISQLIGDAPAPQASRQTGK